VAGLATLLQHYGQLAAWLALAGALYLIWYGVKLLRSAATPSAQAEAKVDVPGTRSAGFRTGLTTSLTNPKSGAFWTSVFAATLPSSAPVEFYLSVCLMIALLSGAWHFGIAFVFSHPTLRAMYAQARRPIEALCGSALVLMGMRWLSLSQIRG
jgi:threonine/homoserine/homoserine lactone efflux protein